MNTTSLLLKNLEPDLWRVDSKGKVQPRGVGFYQGKIVIERLDMLNIVLLEDILGRE
jgi:hypothetical protein